MDQAEIVHSIVGSLLEEQALVDDPEWDTVAVVATVTPDYSGMTAYRYAGEHAGRCDAAARHRAPAVPRPAGRDQGSGRPDLGGLHRQDRAGLRPRQRQFRLSGRSADLADRSRRPHPAGREPPTAPRGLQLTTRSASAKVRLDTEDDSRRRTARRWRYPRRPRPVRPRVWRADGWRSPGSRWQPSGVGPSRSGVMDRPTSPDRSAATPRRGTSSCTPTPRRRRRGRAAGRRCRSPRRAGSPNRCRTSSPGERR